MRRSHQLRIATRGAHKDNSIVEVGDGGRGRGAPKWLHLEPGYVLIVMLQHQQVKVSHIVAQQVSRAVLINLAMRLLPNTEDRFAGSLAQM